MFCYHCGKEIDDNEIYCPFCGHRVKMPAEKTGYTRDTHPIPELPIEEPGIVPLSEPAPAAVNSNSRKAIIIICAVAAALIVAAAFFFLEKDDTEDEAVTETTEEAAPENDAIAGATEFNGNYYEVVNTGSTWHDARVACEEKGGHLAIITSQDEEDFIENLIGDNKSGDIYHYWLGATDEQQEGAWTWLDGQVFWEGGPAAQGGHSVNGMYQNWLPSQPNNSVKENPNGHDYLEIQVTKGNEGDAEYMTWTDITNDGIAFGYEGAPDYNDTKYCGYICEWEGDEL